MTDSASSILPGVLILAGILGWIVWHIRKDGPRE